MKILDGLKFDDKGLLAAVIQDAGTHEVLMVAFMNREALEKTLSTGLAHFWSRSRQKLWLKGESSGHVQAVRDAYVDCDGDAVVIMVEQKGGACHTGYRSCFYRRLLPKEDRLEVVGKKVFDPDKVYK
ncbi:MAG: phosphoribosyl-AMP cyclohydrolase [Candidatus Aureabacteria bacterium]|nr:phosphoribosyl-AMP cyclohydrolase [Candidatus Auribacterota bacterium]